MRKSGPKPGDRLDADYINSLPQLYDDGYPVNNIDVQTGLYQIDCCGLFETRHIDKCMTMKDAYGATHWTCDFELDQSLWEERTE